VARANLGVRAHMTLSQRVYRSFHRLIAPGRRGAIRSLYRLFQVATLVVAGGLAINFINIKRVTPGEWGDFFGGMVNPLLTFLTFMGLLITIFIQQTELRESRREMKRSADALAEQSASLKRQNFESTFFQMIAIHNSIVNAIDLVREDGARLQGRDCFNVFYTRLNKIFREKEKRYQKKKWSTRTLELSYRTFWKQHQTELGHYYRYLYNVVRFVKDEGFQNGPYIRLIRAQLSDQELLLLFYNCVTGNGVNLTPLVEEFALLDNMPTIRALDQKPLALISGPAFQPGSP